MKTMPKYDGTLPEVIASHVGHPPKKSQKEGVWEDTRMLNDKTRCACPPALKGAGHLDPCEKATFYLHYFRHFSLEVLPKKCKF